jgi:hypothetical protein
MDDRQHQLGILGAIHRLSLIGASDKMQTWKTLSRQVLLSQPPYLDVDPACTDRIGVEL